MTYVFGDTQTHTVFNYILRIRIIVPSISQC